MAHPEQLAFFSAVFEAFPGQSSGDVLDIGSQDINGGPHNLIAPRRYVGVDVGPGRNVDLVCGGESIDLPTASFDLTMSSECFEHNPFWRGTLNNMVRMTKPSGLVVVSCATVGRGEHGTEASDGGFSSPHTASGDTLWYQNVSRRDLLSAIDRTSFSRYLTLVNRRTLDLYFLGLKAPGVSTDMERFDALSRELSLIEEGLGRIVHTIVASGGDTALRAAIRLRSLLTFKR